MAVVTASAPQIRDLLSRRSHEILAKLPVRHAQLSLPVDGRGARIAVSVEPEDLQKVPSRLQMKLDGGDTLDIPLEAKPDYQQVRAL